MATPHHHISDMFDLLNDGHFVVTYDPHSPFTTYCAPCAHADLGEKGLRALFLSDKAGLVATDAICDWCGAMPDDMSEFESAGLV